MALGRKKWTLGNLSTGGESWNLHYNIQLVRFVLLEGETKSPPTLGRRRLLLRDGPRASHSWVDVAGGASCGRGKEKFSGRETLGREKKLRGKPTIVQGACF